MKDRVQQRSGALARQPGSSPRADGVDGVAVAPPAMGVAFVDEMRSDAAVPPSVEATLRAAGAPLDDGVREAAERRLGGDFRQVRVHSDRGAAASAREICARAYTVGPHIVFAEGQYAPTTPRGDDTLRHELIHVMQRGPGAPMPGGPMTLGAPSSSHERAARAAHASQRPALAGPPLPAHVVARDVDEDEAVRRAELGALAAATLGDLAPRQPAPSDIAIKDKPARELSATNPAGSSGLTARDTTTKRTEYPRSFDQIDPLAGPVGRVRTTETTRSELTSPTKVANTKDIDSDKLAFGRTFATKTGTTLPDGTEVTNRDAELFIGESEKTTRVRARNDAATSDTTTFKTFNGAKTTINGIDSGGDFRENEEVVGRESRRSFGTVESRDAAGRVVSRERSRRELTTDGRSVVNLRNTGTKYQALDLSRVEALRGTPGGPAARRIERVSREVDQADGSNVRDESTSYNRGTVTSREASVRLAGGLERRRATQSSTGVAASGKVSELSRDEAAGRAFAGKLSADVSYGARSNTTFTQNKPGATAIAPRIEQGSRIVGGSLGLVKPAAPDPRTVTTGDKKAYDADPNAPGGYTESIAFTDGARVTNKDEYELNDRGASIGVSREVEAGTLRSFLRKDRFNLGWLHVENALTDYYFAGANAKAAAGAKVGADVNNINFGVNASYGATRRVGDELTVRLGDFFVKVKAEGDTFAGIEAAISAEGGYTRGAGKGGGVNASAFAGARASAGGKLEGGFSGVAFAAGAYKLRGSLGVGFKANLEARWQNGYFLLSGALGLSAELGVGADVELRINPTAVGASLVKGAAGIRDLQNIDVRALPGHAAAAAGSVARGVYNGAGTVARGAGSLAQGAYRRVRGLF